MTRIVSLIASATEIVHALEMGTHQVGRSHECDFPDSVLSLPICTAPTFPIFRKQPGNRQPGQRDPAQGTLGLRHFRRNAGAVTADPHHYSIPMRSLCRQFKGGGRGGGEKTVLPAHSCFPAARWTE